ncbi:hypothetical protein DWF00_19700 [Bosea caraganae]|uniref:BPL/LPL catalytic domain-containing protein n=1 Tax=Bosea caraganae TaxID=2763117 RepID=A0A370KXI9_9HYPH|nr:biotin/lipoate--protein ligase family protein [Bosea caraganae]RDJ19715.1 hypothetical protein DWE98_28465 [Bosea caraganae]RDJ24359.1 hypothetical protein DWF00_19700 [Bosea caraganae]
MALFTLRAPASLDLPPGFRAVALRESGDAFAHACRIAAEEGAGTLVWIRRFDMAEFAVILEPEAPLGEARKAFFLGMNALLQAIAASCPPERPVTFDWPDAIRFDAGLVGGGRLGWPKSCAEDEVPDWLVFAGTVRVAFPGLTEPGQAPNAAALDDEGFEGTGPSVIIESFARFFMRQVDIWQASGFGPIVGAYLEHLDKERVADALSLTPAGDLVIRPAVGPSERVLPLLPALKAAAWLDRDTGGPKL